MNATEKIIQYFKDNDDALIECIEELDNWNGYLGDDRYYEMYMLAEFYHDTDPIELLNRAYFGHDEDDTNSSFNPNREYFYYNGYGNLVSSDYKDYSAHIDDYLVQALSENRAHLDCIDDNDDLCALFDELETDPDEKAFDEFCNNQPNCDNCKYCKCLTISECLENFKKENTNV